MTCTAKHSIKNWFGFQIKKVHTVEETLLTGTEITEFAFNKTAREGLKITLLPFLTGQRFDRENRISSVKLMSNYRHHGVSWGLPILIDRLCIITMARAAWNEQKIIEISTPPLVWHVNLYLWQSTRRLTRSTFLRWRISINIWLEFMIKIMLSRLGVDPSLKV